MKHVIVNEPKATDDVREWRLRVDSVGDLCLEVEHASEWWLVCGFMKDGSPYVGNAPLENMGLQPNGKRFKLVQE